MGKEYCIYTDGGCVGNPGGSGGYAALIMSNDSPIYVVGQDENTTNQRMELKAAILGLQMVKVPSVIDLYTDSAYLCNCFKSQWYVNWEKNGWKNSSGEPVANKDLWVTLLQLARFHETIRFHKVKGHADNIFNNKCDQLCTDIINFKKQIDMYKDE